MDNKKVAEHFFATFKDLTILKMDILAQYPDYQVKDSWRDKFIFWNPLNQDDIHFEIKEIPEAKVKQLTTFEKLINDIR